MPNEEVPALLKSNAPPSITDKERLDFLDRNLSMGIGWHVGAAPAGNIVVTSIALRPIAIREAIDKCMRSA